MPKFRISQEDINRSKLVEPGLWYEAEILNVYEEPTKAGDSMNTKVDLQVKGGTYNGAMLYRTFNEKAPGFVIPFLKALGIDPVADQDYELSSAVGRKIKVFVKHREYNGVMYNDVVDFKEI